MTRRRQSSVGSGARWGRWAADRGSAAWLKRFLLVAVTLLAAILIFGGYIYYRWEAQRFESEMYNQIAAVAKLKVEQIQRWRHERLANVRRIAESPTLRNTIIEFVRNASRPALRADLEGRLALERDLGEYVDVLLADPKAQLLLASGATSSPLDAAVRRTVAVACQALGPVVGDLYNLDPGPIRIDAAEAVRDSTGQALAVIILSSAAADFLFPMIESWPTSSKTAETLLVRRDGSNVLYLNELRHRVSTTLTMRQPLSNGQLPEARAVLGQQGQFFGEDYRGVKVLADLRAVPETPWFIVTKMDITEVLAEVRFRALAIGTVVTTLILCVAAIGAYVYRTRQSGERKVAGEVIGRSERLLKESHRVAALGHYEFDVVAGTWTSSEGLDAVFGIGADFPKNVGSWMSLVHPDHRIEMLSHLTERVLKEGLPFDREYRIVRASDRAERWVHGLGTLDLGPDGRPARMFGTIQDVTERKQLEEDLRVRNEELTRFIYTVSHDLKSPLVTIRTFLGFLDEDRTLVDQTRADGDIGFIHRAADKMTELLDDLLELSRVGRKVNPPETVPLQELVKGALDMVAGRMAHGHVRIMVTDAPVVVCGDRRRLVEVFQNLLDNAAKFMGDQADPLVEVGYDETGARPALFVRDNGLGIDPRHASKLFGLFEKLHPDTEGTGIGLALVRRIVESHGGRIWAESAGPGRGATFWFTLSGITRSQAAVHEEKV